MQKWNRYITTIIRYSRLLNRLNRSRLIYITIIRYRLTCYYLKRTSNERFNNKLIH